MKIDISYAELQQIIGWGTTASDGYSLYCRLDNLRKHKEVEYAKLVEKRRELDKQIEDYWKETT